MDFKIDIFWKSEKDKVVKSFNSYCGLLISDYF